MKSKIIILVLFYHLTFLLQGQSFHDNTIYIFTRSTQLKASYIAQDFNLRDSLSTHIGIGLKINGEYQIHNVTNESTLSDTALICDNLKSFIEIDGIKYYSIWELKSSPEEIEILTDILKSYSESVINFDYEFLLEENNALYCSEFVRNTLEKLNSQKFSFKPVKKELNSFYEVALNRVHFEYIPVDFFMVFNDFKLVENKYYQ